MQSRDGLARNTASSFTTASVLTRTRSAPGARHRNTTPRDWRCAPQALQRQHPRRRPQKSKESLRSKDRDNGSRCFAIRPKRCDRVHSAERATIETTSRVEITRATLLRLADGQFIWSLAVAAICAHFNEVFLARFGLHGK